MGISVFPDHAQSVSDLMRLADTAMYYAKSHGRNRYMLYNPHIDAQHRNRLSIEVGARPGEIAPPHRLSPETSTDRMREVGLNKTWGTPLKVSLQIRAESFAESFRNAQARTSWPPAAVTSRSSTTAPGLTAQTVLTRVECEVSVMGELQQSSDTEVQLWCQAHRSYLELPILHDSSSSRMDPGPSRMSWVTP